MTPRVQETGMEANIYVLEGELVIVIVLAELRCQDSKIGVVRSRLQKAFDQDPNHFTILLCWK
jgi:hypothetical protein